jgi:hypothetical protein
VEEEVTTPESDVHRLVDAAQATLKDFETLRDWPKLVHLAFAAIQATCGLALSVEHLAVAVVALVVTPEEKP